mmetsp:Transcript_8246/g.7655  ORF Transcript_8246/g.7655 Transcript_8246/m.7655 type:complete len:91 (+) Transcript_8246:417-689(+)
MFQDPTKKFPGPGAYNALSAYENRNGKYVTSRHKSPGNVVIPSYGQRFENFDLRRSQEIPGPGQYVDNFRAKKNSYGNTVFGREKRLNSR